MSTPVYSALALLLQRAESNLTAADLEELASLSSCASDEALRLARVVEGIACLVYADGGAQGNVGNFQDAADVFELLVSLKHSLETIAGMAHVGAEAAHMLRQRASKGRAQ